MNPSILHPEKGKTMGTITRLVVVRDGRGYEKQTEHGGILGQ